MCSKGLNDIHIIFGNEAIKDYNSYVPEVAKTSKKNSNLPTEKKNCYNFHAISRLTILFSTLHSRSKLNVG